MTDGLVAEKRSDDVDAIPRRLWGLLASHVLLPFVCAVFLKTGHYFPARAILGIPLYQLLIVSVWAGLSSYSFAARFWSYVLGTELVVATLTLTMWIVSGPSRNPDRGVFWDFVIPGMISFSVSGLCTVCLLFLRPRLLQLQRVSNPTLIDRTYPSRLGVRHLLVVTALCGVVIAVTRIRFAEIGPPMPLIFVIAILLTPVAASMFAVTWAVLAPRSPWLRLVVALFANIGAAALMVEQFDYQVSSMIAMLPGLLVFVLSLFVIRSAGYRLMRPTGIEAESNGENENDAPGPVALGLNGRRASPDGAIG